LQTDKQNQIDKDPSVFDHCDVTNLKVYLDSESYPYEDMNLDFSKNRYGLPYDVFTKFRYFHYGKLALESLLSWADFKRTNFHN
jgi:uncharacterized membrane-anchored protein